MKAFNGRLVAVVAADDRTGDITLTAEAEGLVPASVTLTNDPVPCPVTAKGGNSEQGSSCK